MSIDWGRMQTAEDRAAARARAEAEADMATAQAFLAATDWMVIRASEGGTPLTSDVREARRAARATISRLREAAM